MPLRRFFLVALLAIPLFFSRSAPAQEGARELALGREAYARGSYQEAVEHLSKAVQSLGGEREALADAYLRLGLAHLIGLGIPAQALPAFLSSAELAGEPATAYLWAALAAKKLGQPDVSARLEAKALTAVALATAAPVETAATAAPPAVEPAHPKAEEEVKPADAKKEDRAEEKVDAFQYFFGKKKPKPAAGDEKPPGH